MDEIWKNIPSCPQMMASSFGRVQLKPTTAMMPTGVIRSYCGKPTYGVEEKTATGRLGPRRRIIRVNRLRKTFKIHQLICEAFHGPKPFDGAVVMHLDENPSNNAADNLQWRTRKQNQNFPKAISAFKARTGSKSCWAIHRMNQP